MTRRAPLRRPLQGLTPERVADLSWLHPPTLWPALAGESEHPEDPGARRATCEIARLDVTLTRDGPLGGEGDRISMVPDHVMLPSVLFYQCWQPETSGFLIEHAARIGDCALIDVGANMGLISRQVLLGAPSVRRAVCVEPDADNHDCLTRNLGARDGVLVLRAGLDATGGERTFFRDRRNVGNHSFNAAAVATEEHEAVQGVALGTDAFAERVASHLGDLPLIWKSDTQGLDEVIVSSMPMALWSRVEAAVIEMWRIEKPSYDAAALRARLECFDAFRLDGAPISSLDEVEAYLAGRDRRHCDLQMWRA